MMMMTMMITILCVLYRYCTGNLSPVCAIIGGVAGQEIVKVFNNDY